MLQNKMVCDNVQFFSEIGRMLSEGHTVTFRAKGGSMYPFIQDGRDRLRLEKVREVAVGDVVLVRLPDQDYVLHRVYKMNGSEGMVLMGDGNLCATEHCRRENVVGKVTGILRNGRWIDCSSRKERIKVLLWRKLLPFRRYLLFACRLLTRVNSSD